MSQGYTTGQIQKIVFERTGCFVSLSKILCVIRKRNFKPVLIAGRYRIFDGRTVDQIIEALS